MIALVQMGDDQSKKAQVGTQHKVLSRNKDLGKARSTHSLDEKQIARAHFQKGWEKEDPPDLGSCCWQLTR